MVYAKTIFSSCLLTHPLFMLSLLLTSIVIVHRRQFRVLLEILVVLFVKIHTSLPLSLQLHSMYSVHV